MMMMGKRHRRWMGIIMAVLMILIMGLFFDSVMNNANMIWIMFAAMASFMLVPVLMNRKMRRIFSSRGEENLSLKCDTCGMTKDMLNHCGKPMHLENVEGKDMLVCWMGIGCGKQDIPNCGNCSKPMSVV